MNRVKISKEAASFIRGEADYLRRRNPQAVGRFAQIVRRAKDTLRTFDQAGNQMHGLQIVNGLTLVVSEYLFDYMIENGDVNVIAVRHGRMLQLTPSPDEDVEDNYEIGEQASSTPFEP